MFVIFPRCPVVSCMGEYGTRVSGASKYSSLLVTLEWNGCSGRRDSGGSQSAAGMPGSLNKDVPALTSNLFSSALVVLTRPTGCAANHSTVTCRSLDKWRAKDSNPARLLQWRQPV